MRITIAGGSGLIGTPLTENLTSDGHEVIVLTRNPETIADSLPVGAKAQKWDAKTAAGWGHVVETSDAIINLAGESIAGTGVLPSRWTKARKNSIRQSRIDAGYAIIQAIGQAEHKPAVLVQASAVGYYGSRDDELITEDTSPGDDYLGQTAVEWEASTAPVETMGVRRVIARTGIVLSMEGGPLPFSVLQFKAFSGGRLGSGKQWMPWIHISDEVAALQFLLENAEARGPYNLCAPNPVTNAEFSSALAKTLGRHSAFFVPASALRLGLGEIATLVLDGQRAVPHRLHELGFQFRYAKLGPTLQNLLV